MAVQFGGKPKQLPDLVVDGHVDLALSKTILEEAIRVLRDKSIASPTTSARRIGSSVSSGASLRRQGAYK
jgi:predicted nucleic acid-binding protein